ncbi:hypothetical protein QJS10_CPB11g01001 [Acorus calamus]|uniref:DUF7032 domain-containing protein n=1 Tax=Acorus calamus TaxID=4465 RepID=A0AAV9DWT8_ACOCL|nr:hypothetical protein QJS10_CPB11g01001 [Acorus calamus]
MKEEEEETNTIHKATTLITSLVSFTHTVKIFQVKWQSIRAKLEQLNSGLSAIEFEDVGSDEDSQLSELARSLALTLKETSDLARCCAELSFSGKLLMQSDLDIIASKLDLHLRTLNSIYASGVLARSDAIVVSKPVQTATRDDMKFYVRDLFTRLRIGDANMRTQALIALGEALRDNERYVKIVAFEIGEILGVLVDLLEFGDSGIQEEAAEVILAIAGSGAYKARLVNVGVIAPLIRVLEGGSELGKERSVGALKRLTENSDNAWSVSAHGGVTALLKICRDCCDGSTELVVSAIVVLRNLSGVGEIRRFMFEEGVVSTLMKLLRSKDEALLVQTIEFLTNIVSGDEAVRQRVVKDGGVQLLVRVLDPKNPFSSKAREVVLRGIEKLCFSSSDSMNVLMGAGFLDRVLFFMRFGEIATQELALKSVFHLCMIEEAKKAMGEGGFMSELLNSLDAKSIEGREMAAEALLNLVSVPKNRKRFAQEDYNVDRILQLLAPGEVVLENFMKCLLSVALALADSNTGRQKIATSKHIKHIEVLAKANVVDAKRILKKLSTNRFRSILNGILSL